MLSITDGGSLSRALSSRIEPRLKQLLIKRVDELGCDYQLEELAHFVIVEPGDTPAELEKQLGFSVFQNPVDGSCFGEPDWTPGWEWLDDHGFGYELCFIMDDSGFGHVVIVPKTKATDPELLRLCAAYAGAHA